MWIATHLVTYGEESDEKEVKEKIQKKVYPQRYGLFTDFSVARQSRIYGFAPSSRLESQQGALPQLAALLDLVIHRTRKGKDTHSEKTPRP